MHRLDSYTKNLIIGSVVIFALIIVAFNVFMSATEDRVVKSNAAYAESTAISTSGRVDDLFRGAQDSLTTAARIYQQTLNQNGISEADLTRISADSMFDYMGYCRADGRGVSMDGRIDEASNYDFFKKGMQGKSGIWAYSNPMDDHDGVVLIYTPVMNDQRQVEGVLIGAFENSVLNEMLIQTFYGEQLAVYLCDGSGEIVSSAGAPNSDYAKVTDIFQGNEDNAHLTPVITSSFETREDAHFTYRGRKGTGAAYLTKLDHYDWMLLCLFPSAITSEIARQANTSGIVLLVSTGVACLLFIVMILMQSQRRNRDLLREKKELSRVIFGVTRLYRRFVLIDLDKGTYEYLRTDIQDQGIAPRGQFRDYASFWVSRMGEGKEDMRAFLSTDGLRAELTEGVPYVQRVYQVLDGDQMRWMQASALVITRDLGQVEMLLLAIQDINTIKEREEQSRVALQQAYTAAEQASKAKSDFLNSMSHDIRTPMNSIMGLTAIAGMYIQDTEKVKDCLTKISASSRHLLGLINEVLDMAKIESGTIGLSEEDFDLPEMVESLLSIIHPQAESKHLRLKVDINDIQHEHVIGDPMRLQQVFVNIMGNAVKFTPEGGTVGLSICERPSRIHGSGCFEFVFSDTGCGMSEEFVQRVFEPFARANDSRVTQIEGTGLGMAIVKSVVSLMNGTIDVESQVDVGTTFTVTLFLKLRDVKSEDLTELAGLPVLIADDDQPAAECATTMLQEMGMKSEWVSSGEQAIQRIQQRHGTGDEYVAVILDWRMPDKSGIETARDIRHLIGDDLPIIILSAYDWSSIEQEARATGVDAFISKPLFRSRLIHVMSELLIKHESVETTDLDHLENQDFSGKRIMLVEDNALAASIAQEILSVTGVAVEHAENGKVAVDLITGKPEGYFDLVLMDVQMPLMNGYEATRAIRDTDRPDLKEIPIIALTADAFNDDVMKAKNAGMNAHMSKPMEIGTLVSTLNQWLS